MLDDLERQIRELRRDLLGVFWLVITIAVCLIIVAAAR